MAKQSVPVMSWEGKNNWNLFTPTKSYIYHDSYWKGLWETRKNGKSPQRGDGRDTKKRVSVMEENLLESTLTLQKWMYVSLVLMSLKYRCHLRESVTDWTLRSTFESRRHDITFPCEDYTLYVKSPGERTLRLPWEVSGTNR